MCAQTSLSLPSPIPQAHPQQQHTASKTPHVHYSGTVITVHLVLCLIYNMLSLLHALNSCAVIANTALHNAACQHCPWGGQDALSDSTGSEQHFGHALTPTSTRDTQLLTCIWHPAGNTGGNTAPGCFVPATAFKKWVTPSQFFTNKLGLSVPILAHIWKDTNKNNSCGEVFNSWEYT